MLDKKKALKESTYNIIEEKLKRNENKFEVGSVFQYGNSKVMYLYSQKNRYYGVDLLWCSIKPRIFEMKEIQRRKLIEIKKLEDINKILELLIEKNIQNSEIDKVYQYVRNLLFSSAI